MKKKSSPFAFLCTLLFLAFAVFMAWVLPSLSSLRFKAEDTRLSLETSRGRESKQQYEYDQVAAELPMIREEILQKQPLAAEAEALVSELKARKKELRARKKDLEQQLSGSAPSEEESAHE